MVIHTLTTEDEVHRYQKSIVIEFKEPRKVLSTSLLNGGYQENLKAGFNHDSNPGAGMAATLRTDCYLNDLKLIAEEIGLNAEVSSGIATAASMENVSIKKEVFEELSVTAIVTGGVEVNGGRVGDPASYHEKKGTFPKVKPGTINIILVIDADLPPGIMARALVTCTEAKTAALQELMAGSNYSRGLATGSGTDDTIIISNGQSELKLTNAGKHSKLGELIGKSVKAAVKEALFLQTGLCPESQYSVLNRMKRFGVDEDRIWRAYLEMEGEKLTKPYFIQQLEMLDGRDNLVVLASLYAHIIDQMDWKMVSEKEGVKECDFILDRIAKEHGIDWAAAKPQGSIDEIVHVMTNNFCQLLGRMIGGVHVV